MENKVKRIVEELTLGVRFTFDGPYMAAFIEKLDKVVEVKEAKPEGQRLNIWLGEEREIKTEDITDLVASATLINNIDAGFEQTSKGMLLWFIWYSP